MRLVDTHTHLYLPEFKNDLEDIFKRAELAGVSRFYLPAIDSSFTNDQLLLEKLYPGKCFAMCGVHPCSITKSYKEQLNKVEFFLTHRSFAAIGEIGLDFYWSTVFKQEQFECFEIQMQWALQAKRPIVIHTRNAMKETIDFVRPFSNKGLKGIFHCFGGSYEDAMEIIDLNFLLGIGGVLTYKKSGLEEVIRKIDLKHIVLETDAPYLTPVPYRGTRNESSYIKIIAQKLADVKGVTLQEVADVTTCNAEKIFSF